METVKKIVVIIKTVLGKLVDLALMEIGPYPENTSSLLDSFISPLDMRVLGRDLSDPTDSSMIYHYGRDRWYL